MWKCTSDPFLLSAVYAADWTIQKKFLILNGVYCLYGELKCTQYTGCQQPCNISGACIFLVFFLVCIADSVWITSLCCNCENYHHRFSTEWIYILLISLEFEFINPVEKMKKYLNKRLPKISPVKHMYKMHNFLTLYEPEINISQFTFFTQIWLVSNWYFLHRLSACSPNLGPAQSMKNSFAPRESKCFVF